jgi:hypothetical protein
MHIELNRQEIEIITKALKTYNTECQTSEMLTALLMAMLLGPSKAEGETRAAKDRARDEQHRREFDTTPILAKMQEVLSRETEFA